MNHPQGFFFAGKALGILLSFRYPPNSISDLMRILITKRPGYGILAWVIEMEKKFNFTQEQSEEIMAAKAENRNKRIDKRLTVLEVRVRGDRIGHRV